MSDQQLFNLNGDPSDAASLPLLPSSWRWSSLEGLVENFDGRRIPVKSADRDKRSGPYPYYGASGVIDDIDDFIFDGDYLLIAEDGANLLSRSTPIAFRASGKFWVNNHAHIVQMRGGIPLAYLEWYLNGTNIQFFITGTAQPKLNQVNLNRIPVPIAPIGEQHRIVAKVEELLSDLDAGVVALERAKANLKRYRAAVLKAAVEGKLTEAWRAEHPQTEPASKLLDRILAERSRKWEADQLAKFAAAEKEPPKNWKEKYVEPTPLDTAGLPELPDGWCWATLDALADVVGGITKDQKKANQPGMREVPYLRVANVQRGWLDLSEMKTIAASGADIAELRLVPGDVLFTEGGDRDKLGRGWVWKGEIEECIHQNHIFRGRLFSEEMMPSFVSHHGNTFGKEWFVKAGKQTTNLASINLAILRRFPIPVPPAAEQVQIITTLEEKLSEIEASEKIIDHGLLRASRLRQSILRQAFEGKLVPQDPTDEPAEALLERIRSIRVEEATKPTTSKEGRKARKITMRPRAEKIPLVEVVEPVAKPRLT